MVQNTKKIFASAVVLLGVLLTYTHCVLPKHTNKKSELEFKESTSSSQTHGQSSESGASQPSSSSSNDDRAISVQAFRQTVYPLTRNNCMACHAVAQQPLHASENVETAHDHIINTAKVNFSNTSNSRLVQRLRDDFHFCWTPNGCHEDAREMEDAIRDWKYLVEQERRSRGISGSEDASTSRLRTSESRSLIDLLEEENELGSGTFSINLASSTLRAPMVSATDNDLTYFYAPVGSGSFTSVSASGSGSVYFNLMPMLSDNYKMWAKVNAPNENSNSFFVRFNASFPYEWHIEPTDGFEWRELTHGPGYFDVIIPLTGLQNHLLEIRHREENTSIADIILTNDPGYDPANEEISSSVILRYDISSMSGVAGSFFEIELEEYDSYSYLISNPRVITPNQPIAVKNINVLINGEMNPQYSTFTLIDTVATPQQSLLLNRSMVVLKDEGSDRDRFSFEFEVLEAR